jgi:hypothetical protein
MRANYGALNPWVVTVGRHSRPCCQLGLKRIFDLPQSRSHAGKRSRARYRARRTGGHSGTSALPRQVHLAGWSPPAISPGWSIPPAPWLMQRPDRRWIRSTADRKKTITDLAQGRSAVHITSPPEINRIAATAPHLSHFTKRCRLPMPLASVTSALIEI